MNRLCHCVLFVLLIAVTAHPQSVEGAWAGMLKVDSGESRLVLHISKDQQGARRVNFRQAKAGAVATETVFLPRTVTVGNNTYEYFVYLPEGFDSKKAYPVLLFLHGLRLKAEDNDKQPSRGLRLEITRDPKQFDSFITVFPKAGVNKLWIGEMVEQAVKALDQTVAEFKADPRQLYLMGNSMGGYGVFYTAARYPGKFAALVAISGGILPPGTQKLPPQLRSLVHADMLELYHAEDPYLAFAKMIGKTPTWIFHGSEDQTVPVSESRKMSEAFKAAKGDVRFTEYRGEGHGVGAKVFRDADLWKWLLAQRLDK